MHREIKIDATDLMFMSVKRWEQFEQNFLELLKMTQQEFIDQINNIKSTLEKVQVEVTSASQAQSAAIEELRIALESAGNVITPEMISAIDSLKAVADSLDAINPDPITPTPEENPQPTE